LLSVEELYRLEREDATKRIAERWRNTPQDVIGKALFEAVENLLGRFPCLRWSVWDGERGGSRIPYMLSCFNWPVAINGFGQVDFHSVPGSRILYFYPDTALNRLAAPATVTPNYFPRNVFFEGNLQLLTCFEGVIVEAEQLHKHSIANPCDACLACAQKLGKSFFAWWHYQA
jgi:hypothetical protein